MNTSDAAINWDDHYKGKAGNRQLFPESFVIRMFSDSAPEKMIECKTDISKAKILDLSCGNGRNLPLLLSMTSDVHASEISESIITETLRSFPNEDIDFSVQRLPFLSYSDSFFDGILACNSCYYIDENNHFVDHILEIHRVLKTNGFFAGTVLMNSHSIFDGCKKLDNNFALIVNDPENIRQGIRIPFFHTESEVIESLGDYFENFKIASLKDEFNGFRRHIFYFTATKKEDFTL